jgi:hypothetical protein
VSSMRLRNTELGALHRNGMKATGRSAVCRRSRQIHTDRYRVNVKRGTETRVVMAAPDRVEESSTTLLAAGNQTERNL